MSSTYKKINNSLILDSKTSTRSSPGNDCPVNYQKFYEKPGNTIPCQKNIEVLCPLHTKK